MGKGGDNCNMNDDREILSVDSPKTGENMIKGPYIVVTKNITERWAIVALDYNDEPCLGIRWFVNENGSPFSRGYPVWFLLPSDLNTALLDGLELDSGFKEMFSIFLNKEESRPTGSVLAVIGELKNLFVLNGYDEKRGFAICYNQYDKIMKAQHAEQREKEIRECEKKIKQTESIFNARDSADKDKEIEEIWK